MPLPSFAVGVSCWVLPVVRVALAGATVTVATVGGAALTVMADVPLLPLVVAVIVAEPAATAETRPLALTVAAAVLFEE